jgi:hypothetical protein
MNKEKDCGDLATREMGKDFKNLREKKRKKVKGGGEEGERVN